MAKAYIPADVGPGWWRDIPGYGGKYRASRAGDCGRKGRMRKVIFYLGTGFANVKYEEIMEFEDGTTDEEISEIFHDWYEEKLDASWWDIKE